MSRDLYWGQGARPQRPPKGSRSLHSMYLGPKGKGFPYNYFRVGGLGLLLYACMEPLGLGLWDKCSGQMHPLHDQHIACGLDPAATAFYRKPDFREALGPLTLHSTALNPQPAPPYTLKP